MKTKKENKSWIVIPGLMLACALFVATSSFSASVLIPLETCGISPATNRNLTLTPLQAMGSSTIPVMDKIQGTTDGNGNWQVTLMPGVYQAEVRPAWGQVGVTEFDFYVDPSNAMQNAFTNLLTATNNTYPPNQYAYSAQASDTRYATAAALGNYIQNGQTTVQLGNFFTTPSTSGGTNSNFYNVLGQDVFYGTANPAGWLVLATNIFVPRPVTFSSDGVTTNLQIVPHGIYAPSVSSANFSGNGNGLTNVNATAVDNVPAVQFAQPNYFPFLPGTLGPLAACWEADQFLGNTNGWQVPTNWTDITGDFTLSNYFNINGIVTYSPNAINGNSGVYFNAGGGGAAKEIFCCSNLPTASMLTNCTIFIVARDMLQDGNNENLLSFSAGNTGNNSGFFIQSFRVQGGPNQDAGGTWYVGITNASSGQPQTMGHYCPDIFIIRFQALNAAQINEKIWLNGVVAFDTTTTANGVGGGETPITGGDGISGNLYIGASPDTGANGWQGFLGSAGIYNAALADDQVAALDGMLEYKYNNFGDTIDLDGASVMNGAGTIRNSNIIELVHMVLPNWNIRMSAVGGIGTWAAYTNMLSWINTFKRGPGKKIVALASDVIYNDSYWLGLPLTASEANITNYAAMLHTNGVQFVLCGPTSAQYWETNTPAFTRSNTIVWERANWTNFADGFCDWSLDPLVGTNASWSNNPNIYFYDTVHPGNLACVSMVNNELVPTLMGVAYNNFVVSTGTNIPPLTLNQPWENISGGHIYYNSNQNWALIR